MLTSSTLVGVFEPKPRLYRSVELAGEAEAGPAKMSGLTVRLDLGAFGQQQFTVPVKDLDATLSGFLDCALKDLEVSTHVINPLDALNASALLSFASPGERNSCFFAALYLLECVLY